MCCLDVLLASLTTCLLHAVWHPASAEWGGIAPCILLTMLGAAQQGTPAVCHRLEALSPAEHVAQSVEQSLKRQRRCAILGSPLAPFMSPHAVQWLLMGKHCPMTCVEGDASDTIAHCADWNLSM